MLAKTESIALVGTEARLVEVEVNVMETGLPGVSIVGLPTASVREAEQRVRSAFQTAGYEWPRRKVIANLAPAALRKEGTHLDLALALAVLAGAGRVSPDKLEGWIMLGELALGGGVRAVRGVLPAALTCRESGRKGILCPSANAPEAALVEGIEVIPVDSLLSCVEFFHGIWNPPKVEPAEPRRPFHSEDLAEVRGQDLAKRALEVAAAGSHNLLMVGPPGSGKTMLARRLPGLLPPMSKGESLEVTRVYSVAGLLDRSGLISERPFRSPHHHISLAGLVGGGAGLARPGEVSLAHRGILFLDELSLYRPVILEGLRGPLEDGFVRIARVGGVVTYPSAISLIAAMNPCPCGYLGDPLRACRCGDHHLQSYRGKISGPLLDRFDMQVGVTRLTEDELMNESPGERSSKRRLRVEEARRFRAERSERAGPSNAMVQASMFDPDSVSSTAQALLRQAVNSLFLTGRGLARVVRVARTIADLEASARIRDQHVAEALSFRIGLDREGATA